MKKQKIQLIVLLIVLVACIGSYFGASAFSQKKQTEEESEESYTALALAEDVEITGISVTSTDTSYELTKEEDAWKFADNADAKVKESSVSTMTDDLAEITGDNEITDVTDFAQYGLDDPQLTIAFTLSDGTGHTVKIGDKNSTISRYYLQVDDSTTVYTVTSTLYTAFNKTTDDLTDTSEEETSEESSEASSDAPGESDDSGEDSETITEESTENPLEESSEDNESAESTEKNTTKETAANETAAGSASGTEEETR